MSYASPAIAIVLMLIGGLLLFLFLGKNPIEGFKVFFISPISDLWGVSELLLKATPLMLIAVGLAIGFRANVWNIGAEGQLVVGGIAASAVALYFQEAEGAHVLILMVIAGAIGGMLWAAIPAFLKTRFNTNEILVSLMLVYVSQLLVSWLVHGPMMDPDGFNFPQSAMFADSALLPLLFDDGSRVNHCSTTAAGSTWPSYSLSGRCWPVTYSCSAVLPAFRCRLPDTQRTPRVTPDFRPNA
jgi:simple sugar transport system permease protein